MNELHARCATASRTARQVWISACARLCLLYVPAHSEFFLFSLRPVKPDGMFGYCLLSWFLQARAQDRARPRFSFPTITHSSSPSSSMRRGESPASANLCTHRNCETRAAHRSTAIAIVFRSDSKKSEKKNCGLLGPRGNASPHLSRHWLSSSRLQLAISSITGFEGGPFAASERSVISRRGAACALDTE